MTDDPHREPVRGPWIQAAVFSPDGKRLVTGSLEGVLAEWDVDSGRRLRVLLDPERIEDRWQEARQADDGTQGEVAFRLVRPSERMRGSSILTLCFSSDGQRLVVGAANGTVVVWNAEGWGEIHVWHPHATGVTALAMSPDRRWLATGCAETGMTTLRVWRMDGPWSLPGSEAFSSDRMIGGVFALSFSPDSRFVATGGWGFSGYSAPQIHELETGERVCCLPWDASRALHYSPDGTLLATGDEFGTVSLWNLATRARILEKKGHSRIVSVVAFSPDGRRLVSGSCDGGLKVWNVATGDLEDEERYGGIVLACRFSEDGSVLSVAEAAQGADQPGIHRRAVTST